MNTNSKNESRIIFEPGKVRAEYDIFVKTSELKSKLTCYIPAFDLIYSANSSEEIKKRADIMVKSFVRFYFEEDSSKNFFVALHKLGFRTPNHNLTMKEALNKKLVRAKFLNTNNEVPEGFEKSNFLAEQTELAVA